MLKLNFIEENQINLWKSKHICNHFGNLEFKLKFEIKNYHMRPHFKIGFPISNFEKAFVVISIAIKIMILIVLNLSILSLLLLPMVKFVQKVATLKLTNTVFIKNIVVVCAKNIRLNVTLNAATMIQARNP